MQFREKGDILFVGLIIAVLFAGSLIVIQSRKYTESLRKINPDYQFPTLLGMLKSTSSLESLVLKHFLIAIGCS